MPTNKRGLQESHEQVTQRKGYRNDDKGEKSPLWVHQRFSHEDITQIFYCLLSVFPVSQGDDRLLFHISCLVTLAETIDMKYLETITPHQHVSIDLGTEFGLGLRPNTMPEPCIQGTNRALPISQGLHWSNPAFYRSTHSALFSWTSGQVETFRDVFLSQEAEVYGEHSVQWGFIQDEPGYSKEHSRVRSSL